MIDAKDPRRAAGLEPGRAAVPRARLAGASGTDRMRRKNFRNTGQGGNVNPKFAAPSDRESEIPPLRKTLIVAKFCTP